MRFESNEAAEQETVISFCELMANRYPELSLIYHVPNGGKRSKTEAARFKRQGVKPGVPDLVLPVPRHGFHGLYIEMKYGKNKASGEQSWWLEQLAAQGYMCVLCVGADAAIRTICDYMRIKGG